MKKGCDLNDLIHYFGNLDDYRCNYRSCIRWCIRRCNSGHVRRCDRLRTDRGRNRQTDFQKEEVSSIQGLTLFIL